MSDYDAIDRVKIIRGLREVERMRKRRIRIAHRMRRARNDRGYEVYNVVVRRSCR